MEGDSGSPRGYWLGYLFSLAFTLWIISLLTDGFVLILYYALIPMFQQPYLLLAINLIAGIMFGYKIVKMRNRDDPLFDAINDTLLVIALLFSASVGILYLLLLFFLAAAITEDKKTAANTIILAIILAPIVVALSIYMPFSASHNIPSVTLDDAIDVYGVYRLVPLYTAYIYGIDRIQLPTHTLYIGDSHLYYSGNTPIYNWIIEPEGLFNSITKKPKGLVLVAGDQYPPNVTVIDKELKYGLHNKLFRIFYFDSLKRQAMLHALGKEALLDENIERYYNGTIYMIIPTVTWERGLTYSIPVPHGFIIVDENGNVMTMTISEAATHPLFQGVPLVPEKVARKWIELYNYRTGFVAYYIQHNRYKIPDVGENPQPYLTIAPNGTLYWVAVVEPAGETYSVKHIMYIPASTPTTKPKLVLYTPDAGLVGVSKVMSYIQSKHPNYDWSKVKVVEPLPTIVNNTIHWKVSIITNDYRGLVAVDLVDARTSQVVSIDVTGKNEVTADQILALLQLKDVEDNQYTDEESYPIMKEILEIKKKINETMSQLAELYDLLEELESKLNETADS